MSFAPELFKSASLILLTLFLYLYLKKALNNNLIKLKNNYARLQEEYNKLLQESQDLKKDNSELERRAAETVALYDITKEICRTLDVDKLFNYFKEQLNKYVAVGQTRFIRGEIDSSDFSNPAVLPLEIDKKPIGYLVAEDIREEDRNKFFILSQQVSLGLKRALLYQQVQELAITDSLTAVFSRRYFLERFKEEIARSKKLKYIFSFLMVDIDYFKNYNDRFGHLVGDVILKEAARMVKENIRQIDLLGKYGGDEFCVILNETDKVQAEFVAERIRKTISGNPIRAYDEDLKITVSIGIAVFPGDSSTPSALIEKADQALYQAKQSGRNKVYTYRKK